MTKLLLTIAALGSMTIAAPASATVEVGPMVGCGSGPLSPPADKCAGYYSKNQFSGESGNVALQQSAINLLIGPGNYTVNWNDLDAAGKIVSGSDLQAFEDLVANASGQVILGLHWGQVPGAAPGQSGNVSAFYLWNNATAGSINLADTKGYSNAVLYRSNSVAAVPEPGTWALMLVGFGAIGGSLRRRRRVAHIPQFG